VLYEYVGIEELDIKMSIATVLGVSIALLLGFRTASAYERWWEARKIWGAIVNDSRTLVRQLLTFINPNQTPPEVRRIALLQIAWIYSLKNSLRGGDLLSESQKYLTTGDVEKIRDSSNKPNEILKLMGIELNKMKTAALIDSYQFVALDHTLKNLCDHMGKSERIRNTVFPIQYASFAKV
jgi:putative membrane protein